MADVIYKRSFYDKICRGIVGIGLLYVYTKGVIGIENFKDSRQSNYKIMEISGNDVLMYKPNEEIIKIEKEWFTNTNETSISEFSVKSIDDAINSIIPNTN